MNNVNNERTTSNTAIKHKDNVFCLLYQDKANLLDLYNALNDSSHTDTDGLTVTTLPGGVYMKYKNDASFVFSQDLYMFEQQASKNPNMPLRFLHYVSDVLRRMYNNKDLHKSTMLKIPVPHFVTFYNGLEPMNESEITLRLSDMFEHKTDSPSMELIVRVININDNSKSDILNKCSTLRDYMIFVNKVRMKRNSYKDIRLAVTEAVDECIAEDILSDFFIQHRDEVIDVSIYEYDEEGHMQVIREESFNKGFDSGFDSALVSIITKKVKKGKDFKVIADELEEDADNIKPIYDAVIASAPDYDENKILGMLDSSD